MLGSALSSSSIDEVAFFDPVRVAVASGGTLVDFAFVTAIGVASGGILVMWDENIFNLVFSSCGEFLFICIL